MYTYRLRYGFMLIHADGYTVGEAVIDAKSLSSAKRKANAILRKYSDPNAPSESPARCLASMEDRWGKPIRLKSSKSSYHWAAFTAELIAPCKAAITPPKRAKKATAPPRRRGEDFGAYHKRTATHTVPNGPKWRRKRGTVGFTTLDIARIRQEVEKV